MPLRIGNKLSIFAFLGVLALLLANGAYAAIIFRWNQTDLSQFTTITTACSATVSGGRIVLTNTPGNHNKDTCGFYTPRFYSDSTNLGLSLEYNFQINDLGTGDGFLPNQIVLITDNSTRDITIPFPDWRAGLGAWLDFSTDPTHWRVIRDTTHNPASTSSVLLTINTDFRLRHAIDSSTGAHTVSVNGTVITTTLGPTASGGSYLDRMDTNNDTQNNDFNNTTDPLTVVGAQLTYTNGANFQGPGFYVGQIIHMTDGGGATTEKMLVTAVNGNDVTFQRGYGGTTIVATPNGRRIYQTQQLTFYFQSQTGSLISRWDDIHVTDNGSYVPPAIGSLNASSASMTSINLNWGNGSVNTTNSDLIAIERSTGNCSAFAEITTVAAGSTGYTNTGLTPLTTYCYRIRPRVVAFATTFNGSYSNNASAVAVDPPSDDSASSSMKRRKRNQMLINGGLN